MSKQRRRRNRSENKTARRQTAKRHLLAERLEDRLLLAANFNPWHNIFVATDVDRDYTTTPRDALLVINDLNRYGSRDLDPSADPQHARPYLDTNDDGTVSPIDALRVINRLNGVGEGEEGDWVGFRLEAQDLEGNPLPNNTVKVGDSFKLQLYTQDLGGSDSEGAVRIPTGVFAAYVDIGYNDENLFSLVWGETQRIELEPTTTGGSYTLTLDGEPTGPIVVSTSIFQSTQNLITALNGLPNVQDGDVTVTNRGQPGGNPFIWDVEFGGTWSNQDVPLMVGDFAGLTPTGAGSSEVTELYPPNPLNSNTFRSAWDATDLYADSVTAWPWQSEKDDDQTPDEFDEVGGVQGNTTFPANRNPPIDPAAEYPVLEAEFIADATGELIFQNNFAEMIASYVLVYGTDTPIPEAMIDFGDPLVVTIIQPVNAVDDEFPLPGGDPILEETTVLLDVVANDILADPATGPPIIDPAGFVDPPDHGTVSVVNNQVQYTPDVDFFGVDEFTYTITNSLGESDTGRVTVTVTNVNDPPVAVDDDLTTIGSVEEDSGPNTLLVLANDNGGGGPLEEGEEVTVESVTDAANGTVSIGPGGLSVIYTPEDDFFGTDTFTYTITDGELTDTATVVVTVDPVNDAPVAVDDTVTGVLEDSPGVTVDVLANDNGGGGPLEEGEPISVVSVTQPAHGEVQIGAAGEDVVYIPDGDFFGTDTFEYTISDGELEATAMVTVTVENVNDPPVATDDLLFVDEFSTDNVLDVLDNDTPGPSGFETEDLSIISVTPAGLGNVTVSPDGQTLIYTPDPSLFGPATDTFDYTIFDGEFTATATVTVEIEPIIRPRARDDQYTVAEDSDAVDNEFDVIANDLFNEGANPLPIVITTPPLHGTATVVNDYYVQYEPADDYFGSDSFEYQIDDDFTGGPSDPDIGLVEITVVNVNDPPVANDDQVTGILEDSVDFEIDVLANDEAGPLGPPAEPDELLLVRVTQPDHGTVVLSGDLKTVLYTPDPHYFGTDSFTYTMTDGEFESTATVDLEVDNVNDPPVANDDQATVLEDSGANVIDVLDNDNAGPGESEPIFVTEVSGAANGVVAIGNGGLTVTYQPNDDFFGTDSFTYTITDGEFQDTATVSITVDNVNDDPTANPDSALALKGFVDQEITGVLDNDTIAPDVGETLEIIGLGPAVEAEITTSEGGTARLVGQQILYTPADGFVDDIDTFTYTISDGNGGTATALISVEVVDAVPSNLSGKVYMDVNGNATWDPQELGLGGVEVTLVGVNIRGEQVNKTVQTDADGVFEFKNILPSQTGESAKYTLSAVTPEYVRDGGDAMIDTTVGADYNPGIAGNDRFSSIELGLFGTDRAENNYLFGEMGLTSKFISLAQYLSSTNTGLVAATTMAGDDYWYAVLQGWDGVESVHVQLASDLTTADLTVVDSEGHSHTKTITYRDYYIAGDQSTGEFMIYFNGSAADFGFDLGNGDLAQADVPAEGDVLMEVEQQQMLAARGQRDFEKAVDQLFGSDDWA